jgi:hypothetical protein
VKKSLFGEQTHSGHLDSFSVFNYCIWEINSRGETAKSSELAKLSKLSSAGGGREEDKDGTSKSALRVMYQFSTELLIRQQQKEDKSVESILSEALALF